VGLRQNSVCSVLNPEMIIYGVENPKLFLCILTRQIYQNNSCFMTTTSIIINICGVYTEVVILYTNTVNFLQKLTRCLFFMHDRKSYARTTEHGCLAHACIASTCTSLSLPVLRSLPVRRHVYILAQRAHTCFN
jgi:hypothetical protein